jgi:hypothetical protein
MATATIESVEDAVLPMEEGAPLPILERRATTIKNRVQCKQDQVIAWLQEFYTAPGNLEKLLSIVQGSCPVSLRLIDYFVTNYSKKSNASFQLHGRHFLVYFNYKRELNAYSKRLFDPFCRRERIMFEARGVEPFVTTVGQLNFFRWFIEKEIYEFVIENREVIERDMNSTLKEHYSRSNTTMSSAASDSTLAASGGAASGGSGDSERSASSLSTDSRTSGRKKRCELTSNAMKKVNCHQCDVVVSFS